MNNSDSPVRPCRGCHDTPERPCSWACRGRYGEYCSRCAEEIYFAHGIEPPAQGIDQPEPDAPE